MGAVLAWSKLRDTINKSRWDMIDRHSIVVKIQNRSLVILNAAAAEQQPSLVKSRANF